MAEGKLKKSRASNLSQTEKVLLAELCVRYAGVIENKKTDAFSAKEKEGAWMNLASEFQACGGERRDWLQLKHVRTSKLTAATIALISRPMMVVVAAVHDDDDDVLERHCDASRANDL